MNFFKRCFSILFLALFFFSSLVSEQSQLLKMQQVPSLMQEILDQHLTQKEMSEKIVRDSFAVFFDLFDHRKIYLLDNEILPYLNMPQSQVDKILSDYRHQRFPNYRSALKVIQNSIIRARQIRKQLQENPRLIIINETNSEGYAKNREELESRIVNDFNRKLQLYAPKNLSKDITQLSLNNLQVLFTEYNATMSKDEKKYLDLDTTGHSLSDEELENRLAILVVKALSRSLDAHTTFFDPNEAFEMKMRLERGYEGIGVFLEEKDGSIFIKDLVEGGPASLNGNIRKGDRLVQIDGLNVQGKGLEDAIKQLRTHNSVAKTLTLERDHKLYNLSLKSAFINLKSEKIKSELIPFQNGNIGIITIDVFYKNKRGDSVVNDLTQVIQDLQQQGQLNGLILDLRNNSGGFLTEAVKVAGLFITSGIVVISKYSDGNIQYYRDVDGKVYYNGPLIVLTSKLTASAAEIVAQALQDYGVALVVGDTQTYGKGTIQRQTVTQDDEPAYFKVTVGKYYTVSGKTPQKEGVKADIVVPSVFDFREFGEEFLEYALSNDRMIPQYNDTLKDVSPMHRPWYSSYYLPSIQKKENKWIDSLPNLKTKSGMRLSKNTVYQNIQHQIELGNWNSNFAIKEDFQKNEAIMIMKDMILINH